MATSSKTNDVRDAVIQVASEVAPQAEKPAFSPNLLVVAIDFGTAYSGFAFTSRDPLRFSFPEWDRNKDLKQYKEVAAFGNDRNVTHEDWYSFRKFERQKSVDTQKDAGQKDEMQINIQRESEEQYQRRMQNDLWIKPRKQHHLQVWIQPKMQHYRLKRDHLQIQPKMQHYRLMTDDLGIGPQEQSQRLMWKKSCLNMDDTLREQLEEIYKESEKQYEQLVSKTAFALEAGADFLFSIHHPGTCDAGFFKVEGDLNIHTKDKGYLGSFNAKENETPEADVVCEEDYVGTKNLSVNKDKNDIQNITAKPVKEPNRQSISIKWIKILLTMNLLMSFMMKVGCQMCEVTLQSVSSCPSNAEEYQLASRICSNACRTSQNDTSNMYQYHCLRNTNKTELVEVCAVPKYLFDHCPMYDPLGKVIQVDQTTKCNANSTRRHYNSSDMFHCDMKCFQLDQKPHDSNTISTPVNNTKRTPDKGEEILYEIILLTMPFLGISLSFTILIINRNRNNEETYLKEMEERNKMEPGTSMNGETQSKYSHDEEDGRISKKKKSG